MDFRHRTVTQLPLKELWNDEGVIVAARGERLSAAKVAELCRHEALQVVVANCGDRLVWKRCSIADAWVRDVVLPHIVDPLQPMFRLEDFADQFAFIASVWTTDAQEFLILLEQVH